MYPKNATSPALFALGFLSIGTQIYLIREFMVVFSDNELIIGLVLASWMLITGLGSFLGRFISYLESRTGLLVLLMILAGVLPPLMVAGLDILKVLIVPYGSLPGIGHVTAACLIVQLPFCLLNGFLFSFLSTSSGGNFLARAYAWESLGSMASGALVNFVFLWFLGSFQGLLMLTGVYLLLVIYFSRRVAQKKQFYLVLSLSLATIVFLGIIDFRELLEKLLYPSQQVISTSETPYGHVVITKTGNQFNFFENGMLLFSSGNEISNEENVHYAMVQHPHPENILLISGGFSGTLVEIVKYNPEWVDYVELNPALIRIAARFTRQIDHPSISVHEMDARKFVRVTNNRYDVILVNLPAPSTLQLNRYYSVEFLQEIRKTMRPGAVIAYSLPTGSDYVSPGAEKLNILLWNTLKQCFPEALVIPGGRNYFLASDSALSLDIPGLIQKRGIETVYVNRYYLDVAQLKERSGYVHRTLSGYSTPSGSINRDFTPVAVWYHTSWWLSYFQTTHVLLLLVFGVILVFMLVTLNQLSAGLFAGGFTLASIEIILIFGLQILCGYLFQAIGAIIMMFMLGLTAGSGIRFKSQQLKTISAYRWLQVLLALFSFLIPLIIIWLSHVTPNDWMINLVFAILAFSTATIVGMEYRMAAVLTKQTLQKTVAGNYSAEMFGSAAGAFAVSLFLIPSIGIVNTGIFLAVLNLATTVSLFLVRKKV